MTARPAPGAPGLGVGLLLSVRFLSELALLGALAVAGTRTADGAVGVLLAVAAPLLAASVWGAAIGPRSARRLPDPSRLAVEVTLFAGAAAWLAATGSPAPAGVLAVSGVGAALATRRWAEGS